MKLSALAPGKVNLCLYLGETRGDGLHPLVSVFQPVTLADVLHLTSHDGPGDVVECPGVEGPNLAAKALAAYRAATAYDGPPLHLLIEKHVPVAAGMGGGSGDAAAALRLIAYAAGHPADPAIHAVAPTLGADVPSQVEPRRALVTGAGEHVEPLPPGPPVGILVAPSEHQLSTPDVFREADRLGLPRDDADLAEREREIRTALDTGALPHHLVHNDLQAAACSLQPGIERELDRMRAAGARSALVSGSGPTVFGLFDSPQEAERAAREHPHAIPAKPADAGFGAVADATLGRS